MRAVLSFLLSCGLCGLWAQETPPEMLIVFHQGAHESPFTQNALQELSKVAESKSMPIQMVDIRQQGRVAEIGCSPAIFYQNHRGRFLYQGRYNQPSKIGTFIRSHRSTNLSFVPYSLPNVYVKQQEAMRVFLHLKTTEAANQPANFASQAQAGLQAGLNSSDFVLQANFEVQAGDIDFYLDFYPYLDEKKQLFLRYAVYSHHDCISPIYTSPEPIKAGCNYQKGYEKAAHAASQALEKLLKNNETGDARVAVSKKIPVKSWEELGFKLPAAPKDNRNKQIPLNLPANSEWIFEQSSLSKAPALNFHFSPPAQQYAGEVIEIRGSIKLDQGQKISFGSFEANPNSVRMGVKELDSVIYAKILQTVDFPKASLVFTQIGEHQPLSVGKPQNISIAGILQLKNVQIPIQTTAQIDCYIDEQEQPRISISAQFAVFKLHQTLGIEVPDAPAESKGNAVFNINIQLKPS